jgi:hypothetical protein
MHQITRAMVYDYVKRIPRIDNIPGWLQNGEGALLAILAQDRVVLELGSYMGRSTVAMAPFARRIYCVDHFHPNSMGQGYNPDSGGVLGEFLANTSLWGHKIAYMQAMTSDALAIRWPLIGLLFIDAGHSYQNVMHDIKFVRFLEPGGVVALHDTDKPNVKGAIADSIMMHGHWEELYSQSTIRAFVKP